jgi:hypothetical protein
MGDVYAPIVVLSLLALAVLAGFVVREMKRVNEILIEILRNSSIQSRERFLEKEPVFRKKMAG